MRSAQPRDPTDAVWDIWSAPALGRNPGPTASDAALDFGMDRNLCSRQQMNRLLWDGQLLSAIAWLLRVDDVMCAKDVLARLKRGAHPGKFSRRPSGSDWPSAKRNLANRSSLGKSKTGGEEGV